MCPNSSTRGALDGGMALHFPILIKQNSKHTHSRGLDDLRKNERILTVTFCRKYPDEGNDEAIYMDHLFFLSSSQFDKKLRVTRLRHDILYI